MRMSPPLRSDNSMNTNHFVAVPVKENGYSYRMCCASVSIWRNHDTVTALFQISVALIIINVSNGFNELIIIHNAI